MLPDNIRMEAHFTHLAPGCPPEPIGTHKHTEIWCIHEGTARLMTAGVTRDLVAGDMGVCIAGDQHTVYNASQTEPASYFVITVGTAGIEQKAREQKNRYAGNAGLRDRAGAVHAVTRCSAACFFIATSSTAVWAICSALNSNTLTSSHGAPDSPKRSFTPMALAMT